MIFSDTERPIAAVPRAVLALLAAGLALQIGWHAHLPKPAATAEQLPPPPAPVSLRLATLGEPITAARLLMLYVQAFDVQPGILIPYAQLDYERLQAWLARILELDPRGQYPLFSASRVYAEVPDARKQRQILDFIYREFLKDPNRRWQWLATAAITAKHRLNDLPLALTYAQALRKYATGPDVPHWATQMPIFILEDMNELESAKILLGGLLESGQIKDPNEARFLKNYLDRLESKRSAH